MIEGENMHLSAVFLGPDLNSNHASDDTTAQLVMKKTTHPPMPFHGFNIV